MNQKTILTITILVLLAGVIFFGFKYSVVKKEIQQNRTALETQKTNKEVLEFAKLFIEKVLKAEAEVDFETRLKLESAVRDLGDEEILTQWQKFTESETEPEAQKEVRNLLEMLLSKISA